MPHTPYPTTCNIWTLQAVQPFGTGPVGLPQHTNVPCFLQPIRFMGVFANTVVPAPQERIVYSAAGTDFQFTPTSSQVGYLELPAGSSRYYRIVDVEDYGKGTTAEERKATVIPQAFPNPIP